MDFLKDLARSALSKLLAQKIAIGLVLASSALASVPIYFRAVLAPHLADPTGWLALRTTVLSAALFPLLAVSYFWYRPKFKYLSKLGVHENIKTGEYFCSYCLITKKLQSPLKTLKNDSAWHCASCSATVVNPDYIESSRPRVRISAGL